MSLYEKLRERFKDGLGLDDLEWAAKEGVKAAYNEVPGLTGPEKRGWVVRNVVDAVEAFDHLIPVVGKWLDNPISDRLVREAIERAVDRGLNAVVGWAYAVEKNESEAAALGVYP